jgi:hypothetical protein
MEFWAQRKTQKIGPFPTRQEAIEAFRATFPHKGPEYMRSSKKRQFHTGYGTYGPHMSIEWHNA